MEATFLAAGIACLIAGLVGGGLKIFGIEVPVLKSVPRQVAVSTLGIILIGTAFLVPDGEKRQNKEPTQSTDASPSRGQSRLLVRYNMIGGPFVVLGDKPRELFAARSNYWIAVDIRLENECTKAVYVDPSSFELTISRTRNPKGDSKFRTATRGHDRLKNRLKAGYLEPGAVRQGRVLYEVPQELVEPGYQVIIRYNERMSCRVVYDPG